MRVGRVEAHCPQWSLDGHGGHGGFGQVVRVEDEGVTILARGGQPRPVMAEVHGDDPAGVSFEARHVG
jgi:hypothetical protein